MGKANFGEDFVRLHALLSNLAKDPSSNVQDKGSTETQDNGEAKIPDNLAHIVQNCLNFVRRSLQNEEDGILNTYKTMILYIEFAKAIENFT